MPRRKPILEFAGEYCFLSNFYPCEVQYQNIVYPSVEHGFQACKSLDRRCRIRISKLKTAASARCAGSKLELRRDWERFKEVIMYNFLKQKFKIPALRAKLIATEDAKLVEGNWWRDTYWGVCNGKGKNRLGKLLMEIRDSIR